MKPMSPPDECLDSLKIKTVGNRRDDEHEFQK